MINRREFKLLIVSMAGCYLSSPFLSIPRLKFDDRNDASWTQWGGPQRNFVVEGKVKNSNEFSKPVFSWKQDLGRGHSAPVSDGEHVYSVHLDGDDEVLAKWKLADGRSVWKRRFPVGFHASIKEYDGPHATPIIVDGQILIANIDAQVRAIDISTGQTNWSTQLQNEFGTILPQAGYASSPLVWKNHIIMPTLGQAESAETEYYQPPKGRVKGRAAVPGAVALDLSSGKVVWRTATFRSSHGSPILVEVQGKPIAVFHGMFELVGVDPQDGNILFRQLVRRVAADNVSFTPIWDARRRQFLIAHGYCDFGAQAIKLTNVGSQWKTDVVWTNNKLQTVHTNGVVLNNLLIGTKRSPATLMTGIDVRSGETKFRQRGLGKSNIVVVGDKLLVLDESGDLVGAELTANGVN